MLHHFATFYTYGSDVGHLIYDNFFNNYIDTNKGRFSAAFIFLPPALQSDIRSKPPDSNN
jgi:hypothetical protein